MADPSEMSEEEFSKLSKEDQEKAFEHRITAGEGSMLLVDPKTGEEITLEELKARQHRAPVTAHIHLPEE